MAILIPIILIFVYFLPSFVAHSNKKRSQDAIVLLNLFAGWTGIFWFVALIWAISKDTPVAEVKIEKASSPASELEKLAELKEKGILTQDEFDAKKKQILGS